MNETEANTIIDHLLDLRLQVDETIRVVSSLVVVPPPPPVDPAPPAPRPDMGFGVPGRWVFLTPTGEPAPRFELAENGDSFTDSDDKIRAVFTPDETTSWSDMTGVMKVVDPLDGIGVLFGITLPVLPGYYGLMAWDNRPFEIHGTNAPLKGTVTTGVKPLAGRDMAFRFRIERGPTTKLMAKIWPDDVPEPQAWQAVAEDDQNDRFMGASLGLWSTGRT